MSDARRAEDLRARLAAQTLFARPLVLEAGAGTGKTAALVARVVGWCLGPGWQRAAERQGLEVRAERVAAQVLRRVAAITFTEAAAAEMGQRVGQALEQIEAGEEPPGVDLAALPAERAERANALRAVLDQLRVQTIHAFCRRLLVEHPLEAGLHPGFGVDADESGQKAVVRQVLESALPALCEGSEALLFLARGGVAPRDIEESLLFLLRQGVDVAELRADPLAPEAVAALLERLRAPLAAFVACEAGRLQGLGPRARGVPDRALAIARLHDRVATMAPGECDARLEELQGCGVDPKSLARWAAGDFGKLGGEALGEDAEALASRAAELLPVLKHALRLDPARLRAAREVVVPLYEETVRRLRARGIETFPGLLADARALLLQEPGVRRSVRQGLDQLLVDEFQDTDPVQCEIVRLLALDGPREERPGLFLVGDPKQSIYGWRNADLAAYDGFVAEVEAAGGRRASLVVNHRSTPAVLDEVSRIFRPLLVPQPGVQPHFESLLSAPEADDARFDGERAPVEHWVSWRFDSESGAPDTTTAAQGDTIEAAAVAADVAALGAAGTPWKSIGLLFRAGTALETYLSELRRAGVPFAVEGDRSYFERREIIEAGALVRCVLDPHDHLALLTLLRSAVVGVPDGALVPLWARDFPDRMSELYGASAPEREALRALVAEAEKEVPSDLPGIERVAGWADNLAAAARALGLLRESFDVDAADVFVEKLRNLFLFEATEAARYLGAYRLANLDRFFRDLWIALRDGEGDPQAVLRGLREDVAERREAEEGRPREAITDAVQVMTIHKAKGLDFDHVYVLQLHKARGNRPQPRAERVAGRLELELFEAPTLGYDRVEARREAIERAEQVRTLYVAATRARKRLVLAGIHREHAFRGGGQSHAALLERREPGRPDFDAVIAELGGGSSWDAAGARWVFPALRPPGPGARAAPRPAQLSVERVRATAAGLARGRAAARAAAGRSFGAAVSQTLSAQPPPARGAPAGRAAAAAGTLVHRALEHLDLEGDPVEQLALARARLAEELLPELAPATRDAAVVRADQVLAGLGAGPLLRRFAAIAPHVVARELPVLLPPDATGPAGFLSGAVDLVYRDPDSGEFVVVDYKTDRIEPGDALRARAGHYAVQGEAYTRAVREALGLATTPRFELWFLAAGEIFETGSQCSAS